MGLSAACVAIQEGNLLPRFFLFSDIDTHDTEVFRSVCQHFARNGLSFYTYQTTKGYHVISPDLLTLNEWNQLKSMIKKLVKNYYRFEVIRISPKPHDGNCHYFDQWHDKKHSVSGEFMKLMSERFQNIKFSMTKSKEIVTTRLQYVCYTHHELEF